MRITVDSKTLSGYEAIEYYKIGNEFDMKKLITEINPDMKFNKRVRKAIMQAYSDKEQQKTCIDKLERKGDMIKTWNEFVNVLHEKSATITFSKNDIDFCNANADNDGYARGGSCHDKDGEYHWSTHVLATIKNYYIMRIVDGEGSLLMRMYFYYDETNNSIYQTGGYSFICEINDGEWSNQNGFQVLGNILFSKLLFETLNTRAKKVDISINHIDNTYFNENNNYQTWVIYMGNIEPRNGFTLYPNANQAEACEDSNRGRYCEECERYHDEDDVRYMDATDRDVCEDCNRMNYTYCDECCEYDLSENVRYMDATDRDVCEDCIGQNYTYCDECCEYVESTEESVCQNCEEHAINEEEAA